MSQQEHSTDLDAVAVHWCYSIGTFKDSRGGTCINTVTVRRPTKGVLSPKRINTRWDKRYDLPPGRWVSIGVYERSAA